MLHPILIFDFDGTIADTFHFTVDISNRLAEEFNYKTIKPDELEDLKDLSAHEMIHHLSVPLLKIPVIVSKAKDHLQKEMPSVQPIDGLKETLEFLRSLGYQMGILSSNSKENVTDFLKRHGINFFDFIETTSKIWSKHTTLEKLRKDFGWNINDMLYIGDETRDVDAARKAGVKVAAVTWGYNSAKRLQTHHPDYILNTPQELLELCSQTGSQI